MPFIQPEDPRPVRAKFYVHAVEITTYGTIVKMRPVTRGEDNKEWSAATPSGELSMTISNEVAAESFGPGQEWALTFTPIQPDQVGKEGMD